MRETLDCIDGNPANARDPRWRVVAQYDVAQLMPAYGHLVNILTILQTVAKDHVHESEGEGGVSAGTDGDVLVARHRRARPQRIDANRRRALRLRCANERP